MFYLYLFDYIKRWEGSGANEVGKEKDTGIVRIKVNPKYYRPTEVVS